MGNSRIKFRAWDKNSGKYIDLDKRHNGILYHQGELHISQGWDGVGLPTFYFSEDDINYHKRDCIFEQFTGLCDKNKKDSYDGDKIRTANWGDVVIEWNNNASCFGFYYYSLRNKSLKCWVPLYKVVEFEVIGNIHEEQK